jgi:hypothetical protein
MCAGGPTGSGYVRFPNRRASAPLLLKTKTLKEVRLELAFIPSQFREETLNFTVSIGGQ